MSQWRSIGHLLQTGKSSTRISLHHGTQQCMRLVSTSHWFDTDLQMVYPEDVVCAVLFRRASPWLLIFTETARGRSARFSANCGHARCHSVSCIWRSCCGATWWTGRRSSTTAAAIRSTSADGHLHTTTTVIVCKLPVMSICRKIWGWGSGLVGSSHPNTQRSRFMTACRCEKLVLPSISGHKSFILDDAKLAELSNNSFEWKNVTFSRGGSKHTMALLHIFKGLDPHPSLDLCLCKLLTTLWRDTSQPRQRHPRCAPMGRRRGLFAVPH